MTLSFVLRTSLMRSAGMALTMACAMVSCPSTAQTWPSRAIKIIAPFPPGGFTDVVTRQMAVRLGTELGQPVIVENRPGAGTNIGTEAVVQSTPDGYTLLMGTSSLAINPTLYKKLSYSVERDLKPLGIFATTGYTLLANPDLPANTVREVIALAKARPNTLSYGSSGNGAVNHLAGALFTSLTGTAIQHVPYKGSQAAITDLIGGQIQLFWASNLEAMPMLKAGRVKALGVTTASPVPALPSVPAIGDTVKNYEVVYWMGLFAPSKTPPAVLERLSSALKVAATSAEMHKSLADAGAEAQFRTPEESSALLHREIDSWGKTVRTADAKVD